MASMSSNTNGRIEQAADTARDAFNTTRESAREALNTTRESLHETGDAVRKAGRSPRGTAWSADRCAHLLPIGQRPACAADSAAADCAAGSP